MTHGDTKHLAPALGFLFVQVLTDQLIGLHAATKHQRQGALRLRLELPERGALTLPKADLYRAALVAAFPPALLPCCLLNLLIESGVMSQARRVKRGVHVPRLS